MKVKKTVAALCLAAIMATSVGASAYTDWKDTRPKSGEGSWDRDHNGEKIYSTYYPEDKIGRAGAYVSDYNINYYDLKYLNCVPVVNAEIERTAKSKKGNSPMCKFWRWDR